MTNRINDQSQPMFYLDYDSIEDVPYILDYLKKRSGNFAVYFNGITVAFTNDGDRYAFVNGLKCIYNILK
jgi:hypothetical protein